MFIMLKVTNVEAPAIVRISDYSNFMATDTTRATKDQKKQLFILDILFYNNKEEING